MSTYEYISIFVALLGVFLIPASVLLYRAIVKWTRTESRLDHIAETLDRLMRDKDETHRQIVKQMAENMAAIQQQMKDDRQATNDRLTWLEHNLWNKKQ